MSNRLSQAPHISPGYACIIMMTAFSILFFLISPPGSADTQPVIKQIELQGNRKISDETIYSKMKSSVGSAFSKNSIQYDIKELYNIGYFDDIRVEIESFEGGVKIIFIFREKPTIVMLDFQGNEELDSDNLKEKITLTSGAIANLHLIADNIQKIIAYYQSEGYWLVRVIPIIREISEDAVALTFQIKEGPKVKISEINIEGNDKIPDKKIRKFMNTKKWWIFSFLTGSGTYTKEQIRADIEGIKALYHNHGYIHVTVSEPEITLHKENNELSLTINISEGDQYRTGEVRFKGNTVFNDISLFDLIETATGSVFDRSALRSDIDRILDLYMEKGYARADINPVISVNKQEKTADITFSVHEGGIFRIGRVNVTGNTKTRDKVIRREVRLDEGDIFNKKLITRSYQRINNLNYFETVSLNPTPRIGEKLVDLNIDVKEKMTGMLSIGGGYSSIDQFVFMSEISQTNLFGRGYDLKFKVDLSARRSNYRISFTDPWFLDKPVSASISLYNDTFQYPDYDKDATGGSLGFGKELSEYVRGRIVYNYENVNITDVSDTASRFIQDQEGRRITSSISPSIWKDTRNNYLDPTSGSRNALYTTIAGIGGDNYFFKGIADSVWFFPSVKDTTFSIRGRFGYATGYNGKDLPLYERFYVGGINTIRGLDFGEGGPRDEEGEVVGGERELIFNTEYIIPISKDIKLKGLVFFDYGAAFDGGLSLDEMRKTAGFGIRWISPLGPIRLEWGFNLDPREDEDDNKIEFSLGGFF